MTWRKETFEHKIHSVGIKFWEIKVENKFPVTTRR
jgi:hypothetical protein